MKRGYTDSYNSGAASVEAASEAYITKPNPCLPQKQISLSIQITITN